MDIKMGMQQENVNGWDEFSKLMTQLEKKDVSIYVLFVGETLVETGKNWCPDCVKGIHTMPACVVFIFNGWIYDNLHGLWCNVLCEKILRKNGVGQVKHAESISY